MKLHLGCADQKLSGWINIDSVSTFNPDLVHDLSEPLPYEDLSVDEVMAKDLLEHFDKYVRYIVFHEWIRVLKIGGLVHLELPDFEKTLKKKHKFTFENFVDFIFGENMIRSRVYSGHYGNHKFGYSQKTLASFVQMFGVETVKIETKGLNIGFLGKKMKHVSQDELDNILIHSHANSFGDIPDLKLSSVRQYINEFQSNSKVK